MLRNTSIRLRAGVLAVIGFLFFCAPSLIGQTSATGALIGTVTDPSGALVPNVTVTVTSVDTSQTRSATTGGDGSYRIGLLPPGNYRVKFESAGFQSIEIPSVAITVTETATLNQVLKVGAQTQQVTVNAEVENVQTENATVGAVMNSATVAELPLATRNYQDLLGFSPGAASPVANAASFGKSSTTTAVNGASIGQNAYAMDGVYVDNWMGFNGGQEGGFYGAEGVPNPDAIAEFKIQTSNYDAGYGRDPGANVNVVTKSGTNAYHGTAFEFLRNTVLNANDFFANLTHGPRLALDQNQYGGVLGGPIKKDKLFFFVSYQGTGQKNGLTAPAIGTSQSSSGESTVHLAPIPSGDRGTCPAGWTALTQCDSAAQAFVPALGSAICPANNPGNAFDKTATPNSIQVACDGSNISPVAVNILQLKLPNGNYYVPGSGASPAAAYPLSVYTAPAIYSENQVIGNVDYIINSRNTLAGRYFYGSDPSTLHFNEPDALPGISYTTDYTNNQGLLRLTTVISNNLVNEARVSFQRDPVKLTTPIGNSFTDTQVGIPSLNEAHPVLSLIAITGAFDMGNMPYDDYSGWVTQFQAADQISWTHGKQSIRAGFEAERIQANQAIGGASIGSMNFGSFPDFLIGRGACPAGTFGTTCSLANPGNSNGTSAASNISSEPTVAEVAQGGNFVLGLRVIDFNTFIQDDVKVNSRLTVNLGLRWEFDGLPTCREGGCSSLAPNLMAAGPIPGTTPDTGTLLGFVVPQNYIGTPPQGVTRSTFNSIAPTKAPLSNFAPRVGIAWQPLADNAKWVIRAGGGFFYDREQGQSFYTDTDNAQPFEVEVAASPYINLQNPFQVPATVPAPPIGIGFTPRWINFSTNANSFLPVETDGVGAWRQPLLYEWNLDTQYEFARNWVLDVGYVGSHGIHQMATAATDYENAAPLASATNPIHCGYDGVPTDCITTNTAANAPARVPQLGLAPGDENLATDENFKYNSLQVTVRKLFSHGLQLQAAYTFARAFASVPLGVPSLSTGNVLCCIGPQLVDNGAALAGSTVYGLNTSYRPQRLSVNYHYDLPFGHPEGIAGKLAEGWSVSGVTTIQDGLPLNITDSRGGQVYFGSGLASAGQFCAGQGPSDVATSGSLVHRVLTGYMNKTGVFCAPPAVGTDGSFGFGDAGLGTLLGPGQDSWDIALAKRTTVGGLREDASLEFRTEFFNTFNHPNFSNPGTNVNSATFGTITSSSVNPRVIQFALKYAF
jgi:hypothetical protein